MKRLLQPEPRARVAAGLLLLAGALLAADLTSLGLLYCLLLAVLAAQDLIPLHFKFLSRIWLPVFLGLLIVWGLIVRGTPHSGGDKGALAGVHFAGVTSFRLAVVAAVFQVIFLSVRGTDRARFLAALGLSASSIAMIVSVFNLWPQFQRKADQLVAARCARGLMPNRRVWTRIRQLSGTFRLLFISSLEESLDRVQRWESEGLLGRLGDSLAASGPLGSRSASTLWLVIALLWCTWGLFSRSIYL
jgi:hypothetical protein